MIAEAQICSHKHICAIFGSRYVRCVLYLASGVVGMVIGSSNVIEPFVIGTLLLVTFVFQLLILIITARCPTLPANLFGSPPRSPVHSRAPQESKMDDSGIETKTPDMNDVHAYSGNTKMDEEFNELALTAI